MRRSMVVAILAAWLAVLGLPGPAPAETLQADLEGIQEVPALSTGASGKFRARINRDDTRIDWVLSYEDLEGAVQQGHIHIGQKSVNGGITVFLCTNLGNGPMGTQPCPAPPATISGTIIAADVSPNIPATAGARTQGLGTGEFEELLRAIRNGVTYANVHSDTFPGGEIRGQIKGSSRHDHDDD
jgi:CHRD domain